MMHLTLADKNLFTSDAAAELMDQAAEFRFGEVFRAAHLRFGGGVGECAAAEVGLGEKHP